MWAITTYLRAIAFKKGGTYGAGNIKTNHCYKHGTPTELCGEYFKLRRSTMFVAIRERLFGSVGAS
ncbi:hypothetical protein LX99_04917 [Mucilaginibacter oryzae]|uniref:Uncharacterized protein n=1 Tax=Mucilaginibacter oryzae TaxID=468058 RepID=A0A316HAR9_9SPHI|nr:hypothetical protein LX99_04917 [Mucilaginibacter oryzae]